MRNALRNIQQHWHVAWLPPSNPHKTEPAATLSLDWAAVRYGAPPRFSRQVRVACSDLFFDCQGHYPYWHSSVMRILWAIAYRRQKRVKVGQRVQTSMTNSVLVGLWFRLKQLQKWNKKWLKIHAWVKCVSRPKTSWKTRSSTTCATWRESSMTRVYEKCHSACKNVSIATVITSKNSWKFSISINVTIIVNKRVFYVKRNWRPYFADRLCI